MTPTPGSWLDRFRASLPTKEELVAHPWLKPVAERLLDPQLWRLQHEAVARGVAIGTFWAFVIPGGQIIAASAHCTLWRGNIPVAAAMTMVTNPITIGFWLWLAYQVGSTLLGDNASGVAIQGDGLLAKAAALGWPTVFGMGLFATVGAATGYGAVKLGWRVRIWFKRRGRS
jgi:uncharacterized protein